MTNRAPSNLFNTLIRTHHITSRKKIHHLKKAAAQHRLALVLLRTGGSPGVMYAEADGEARLGEWVAAVQALRYKDYQCVYRPAAYVREAAGDGMVEGFSEVESLGEFADMMERRGLTGWWRRGMGYGE